MEIKLGITNSHYPTGRGLPCDSDLVLICEKDV